MQVLAGALKGRLLKTPKGQNTRPTIGKVKKAVFDICRTHLHGCHFLDLFAGSGQMGIEALSRSGAFACFVERDKLALNCLYQNLDTLGITEHSQVMPFSVERAIPKLIQQDLCFDLIYLDPPYGSLVTKKALKLLDKSPLYHPESRIFLEENSGFTPIDLEYLQFKQTRNYGETSLFELGV